MPSVLDTIYDDGKSQPPFVLQLGCAEQGQRFRLRYRISFQDCSKAATPAWAMAISFLAAPLAPTAPIQRPFTMIGKPPGLVTKETGAAAKVMAIPARSC